MLVFWPWDRGFHGRVDQAREPVTVDGRRRALFVCTTFYVVYGFPLFPFQTYAVLACPGLVEEIGLWIGIEKPVFKVEIRLSLKSIFFGYLRAVLAYGCPILLLLGLIMSLHGPREYGLPALALGAGCPFALLLSYRVTRAGPDRVAALRQLFETNTETSSP
jgi:hypothetical protein